jgi:hypothetical protein
MKSGSLSLLARTVLVIVSALPVLLAASPASPVAASPPTREPLPSDPLILSGYCSFDV